MHRLVDALETASDALVTQVGGPPTARPADPADWCRAPAPPSEPAADRRQA